jgi:hypothetical protein
VTRHTNSTFLPTTPLHHPRYLAPPPPPPPASQGQGNLQPPPTSPRPSGESSLRRSGVSTTMGDRQRGDHQPPPTPTSPASFLQPAPAIPSAARLSGIGSGGDGGEGEGYVKVQVRRPP